MNRTTYGGVVPPEEDRAAREEEPDRQTRHQTFDDLGVLGVDGFSSSRAQRVGYAPRSFEKSTEAFARKTGMRDRGTPGYEYNDMEHLSVSASARPGTRKLGSLPGRRRQKQLRRSAGGPGPHLPHQSHPRRS
ncbi:unnamed protein product, partial [Scytosiphon promiscuus]